MRDSESVSSTFTVKVIDELIALLVWVRDNPQAELPPHDRRLWWRALRYAIRDVKKKALRRRKSRSTPPGTLRPKRPGRLRKENARRSWKNAVRDMAEREYRVLDKSYADEAEQVERGFRDKRERLDSLVTWHRESLLAMSFCTEPQKTWDLYSHAGCPHAQKMQGFLIKDLGNMRLRLEDRQETGRRKAGKAGVEEAGKEQIKPPPKLPNLGPHDRQAYQLSLLHGMIQEGIAQKLNGEHGTLYTQGQVSRMIARAKRHAEASGLANLVPDKAKPAKAMDPSRLELGRRTDGHRSDGRRSKRDPSEE